ncbi:2-hydroxy-3-oxopropionate reductase [Rubripirellula lacrimiformis]|uniref:2-hydroxy-3-oxopropionate reductase n=1 Tax=Rubripirellula lacrimiformis TaxID=1930273 RepID=A0A517NEM9_9BACT|nr:NAD(P)-dependent oxidoreductase [Rubripirellula lacrimiformis]QDT05585.1 2-hydroxy-3-oxopropionate reductase [Rubripirellula lacrimiformis]
MTQLPTPVKVTPSTRIGWIGTGVMGRSMCGHLIDAGYAAAVFNRSPAKADDLVSKGAVRVDSPRLVAEASDVIFTIVGFPSDVESVILGDDGVLAGASPGSIIVDMTTSKPSLAIQIAEQAARHGVHAIDAPVSGGDLGARNAGLSIMVGGEADAVAAVDPLLQRMGKTIVHQGPAGSGQHTKMVNQTLIAAGMVAVCEALLYAERVGLDLEKVLQSVSSGAAGSWSLSNLAPRMIAGDFAPGFYVEHFIKDMGIALDEAARMGLELPGLAMAHRMYQDLAAAGHSKSGTQALLIALRNQNTQ